MRASREWTFFCIVTPGLEELALREFALKQEALGIPLESVLPLKGGFEFRASWELGRGALHLLKIPTRVLLRLEQVRARDFPKLFARLKALPWGQYLTHPQPLLKISCEECRLMHTDRLAQTLSEALAAHFKGAPLPLRWQKEGLAPDTLFVRGVRDVFQLSLDLTGEALYKRGISVIKGEAPLRENLASALLLALFTTPAPASTPLRLWDPFCGSGTFLFEAAQFFHPSERTFAYQRSIVNLGVAPWRPRAPLQAWPVEELRGTDLQAELIKKLTPLGPGMSFAAQDFFTARSENESNHPLWMIANPPYGERLELAEGIRGFARRLAAHWQQQRPARSLILVPASWPQLRLDGELPRRVVSFSNGGLAVEARLWWRD
mgnify:CR=1 FL=1